MNVHVRQIRRLSWFLLASLSLNGCLISFLVYWVLIERPPTPFVESPPAEIKAQLPATHAELTAAVGALKALSIEELVIKLHDKRVVENGFTVGDLSLAVLTGYYYLDVERALNRPLGRALERAVVSLGKKGETLVVYPTLSEVDLAQIEKFMKQEKWPYRAQGLYRLLKSKQFADDPSLKEAFFLTPEFLALELLFSRASVSLQREEVLNLILSEAWGRLAAFHEKQRGALDLSEGARRLYLLEAIEQDSYPAALLLLKTDREFALKKLEDKITLKMLSLLKVNSEIAEPFAKDLLKSPRSERVRSEALSLVKGEAAPSLPSMVATPPVKNAPFTPLKPKALSSAPLVKDRPRKERIYIVQPRETLAKIASRFKLDVEIIKKMNGIVNADEVKAGRPLRLPEGLSDPLPDLSLPSTKGRI